MTKFSRRITIATGFALLIFAAFLWRYANKPTFLTVAVSAEAIEINRVLTAVQQAQQRDRAPVRVKAVPKDNSLAVAQALKARKADLAILRSDVAFPDEAQVVAIWQKSPIMLITLKDSGIDGFQNLKDKRVALIGYNSASQTLFQRLVSQHGLSPSEVGDVQATPQQGVDMLQAEAVNAVFLVGPPSARAVRETISLLIKNYGVENLKIAAVKQGEAIAKRMPSVEASELESGALNVAPPFPPESVELLELSHFLVTHRDLSEATIASLTEQLFTNRRLLSIHDGSMVRIEPADTDKSAVFPVHPGAEAYYNGEQKTFLERYSDYLYLLLFLLSLGGSAIAGVISHFNAVQKRKNRQYLRDILVLVHAAREADSGETLDMVSLDADNLFSLAIHNSSEGQFDAQEFASISMALDHLRAVIADRRRALTLQVMEHDSSAYDSDEVHQGGA